MAKPVRRPARPKAATQAPGDLSQLRLQMQYTDITDIKPYRFNARDNREAIEKVANSIKTFGFLIPCVIDSEGVLGAGHTRVEAAKLLGLTAVPTVLADHLTEQQMNAFRIIDNKVAEIADWDFEMLADEIQALDGLFEWTDFGFTSQEVDCLNQMVADDCLSTASLPTPAEAAASRAQRRAPTQARFVCGELTFFVPAAVYRSWAHGLRSLHNFDEDAIASDLKQRLGILE
jgi:hypothetical protein